MSAPSRMSIGTFVRNLPTAGHDVRPMGSTGGIGGGGWVAARHRSAVVAALAALALVGLLCLELAFWDISSSLLSVDVDPVRSGPTATGPSGF